MISKSDSFQVLGGEVVKDSGALAPQEWHHKRFSSWDVEKRISGADGQGVGLIVIGTGRPASTFAQLTRIA